MHQEQRLSIPEYVFTVEVLLRRFFYNKKAIKEMAGCKIFLL